MKQLKEGWKPIKNYEGLYKLSNYGEIKSFHYRKERVLKYGIDIYKYFHVILCKDRKRKNHKVSLLVWDHFGNRPRNGFYLQIDHIDGNKQNDRIDNLQLLTQRQNTSKGFIQNGKKTSKFTGVYWNKHAKKWKSQIIIDKEYHYLGYFKDEFEAHLAYQKVLYINRLPMVS